MKMDSTIEPGIQVFIKKEELSDEFIPFDTIEIKEEVASICDDEQVSLCLDNADHFEVNNQFTLDLDEKQVENYALKSNALARKRKKKRKSLKNQKVKEFSISGRISLDAVFKDKEYFCDQCQKLYLGRKCFRQHLVVHFTKSQDKYACIICRSEFETVSHMNRHLVNSHFLVEAEKVFTCTHCQKKFNNKKDLQRHIFVHTRQGSWKCEQCEYSCMFKFRLESHMCSHHGYARKTESAMNNPQTGLTILTCDYCNYVTREKTALRSHISRHMAQKNVKCPECSYRCTTNSDMKKHSVVHSNDRPFVCSGCSKGFKRKSHLLIHFNLKYGCSGRKKGNKIPRV